MNVLITSSTPTGIGVISGSISAGFNMTPQVFVRQAAIDSTSRIFAVEAGRVVVADEHIRTIAFFSGIGLNDIVQQFFATQDLSILFGKKPRKFTGEKWTRRSKKVINNELEAWNTLKPGTGVFSRDDIEAILVERQRLSRLKPCYTYDHLRDCAHYKKGLSWTKADSYAKWACCACCYD
jgi:hypothetical protein